MSIYDIEVKKINGETIHLNNYKDKVMLIVNTASKCGFTPQYASLEKLYRKYREHGFVILGFPCNQFANQEPGTNEEILEFTKNEYDVTFDMFEKIEVNGNNTHELYKLLKSHKAGILGNKIKWNFTKFLVHKEGNVIRRFSPTTKPEQIEEYITKLL
ncbi:glutathione peroxidase [Mycoplasmatota bacterium WC44]